MKWFQLKEESQKCENIEGFKLASSKGKNKQIEERKKLLVNIRESQKELGLKRDPKLEECIQVCIFEILLF